MDALKLSLLGPFLAALDDTPIDSFPTSKVQALLIYLAVEGQATHRREHLMELLWPGMPLESAQVNLRQTLYRLRKTLPEVSSLEGDSPVPLLLTDRQTVRINPKVDLQLDVAAFQALLDQDPAAAIRLYRGDFLTDFYLVDSSEFDAWAESWRENLRRTCLETAFDLAEASLEAGDYPQAQAFAWRELELDHLSERAYRQLMTALGHGGQRNAALAQYQVCRRRLLEELGLEPSTETTALYEQIQADALKASKSPQETKKPKPGAMPVFLLTDIEGSTRLWDTYRQAMLPALLQHNAILEECITQHGGRILELRGDGVKAVFEGVNPLQCTLDIQMALGAADWGEIGDLRIRMGLHGVPPVRKDFDYFIEENKYFGPVLNHTARIMDAGHGGQILASEQVYNAFSLPLGARWQDFGPHPVKSLDQPLPIYSLLHPDLPHQAFPPLRTGADLEKHVEVEGPTPAAAVPATIQVETIRHNLPAQPTPFIGREEELADLETLINNPETRLITILGPGGMGKTRLALATAERITEMGQFPQGVYFVDLAPLVESHQIVSAIAGALNFGLQGQEDRTPQQQLVDFLSSRKLLLLLDNCEHLLEGVAVVAEILQAAPEVQVLATSRERLQLRHEQVYPIEGLEFPDWETPEDAVQYTAVRLFLMSAHRNQPDFALQDDEDLTYLAQICRLVGGMPLALELAAAWVDTLPVAEISTGIQAGLDFLESDLRDLPVRHRSIQAVIDHSWDQLREDERAIFAKLSVFRSGFTREAGREVAEANLRQLSRLVNKSFLRYDPAQDRYQVHELLRQYGASQLDSDSNINTATLRRRTEYYCAEVEGHHRLFSGGQAHTAVDQFKIEADNILAAWEWALENREIELVDQAIDGIVDYYEAIRRWDLGRAHCQAVLDMLLESTTVEQSDPILGKRLHTKTLLFMGWFNVELQHDRAANFLAQAAELIEELIGLGADSREEKSKLLLFRGGLNLFAGDLTTASLQFKEAVKLSKEIDLIQVTLWGLIWQGNVALTLGAPNEAQQWFEESLEVAKAHGHQSDMLRAYNRLGYTARALYAYEEAQAYHDKAIELAKQHNNSKELNRSLGMRGDLSIFLGRFTEAINYYSQATDILENEYEGTEADVNIHRGVAYWLSGDFSQAASTFEEAQTVIREYDLYASIQFIILRAEFQTIIGHYHEANQQISGLDELIQGKFIDHDLDARRRMVLGWIALGLGEYVEADQYFNQSIQIFETFANDEWIAWSQAGLAGAAILQDQWEEASAIIRKALRTSIDIQGFIPLLFSLPFACLYLAQTYPDPAREVYARIQTSPFLANAQFFKDTVYRHLPDEVKHKESMASNSLSESELIQNLWETAGKIMTILEAS